MATEGFKQWWCQFARTGNIAPLALGCTRDELREMLGEPDDFSVEKSGRQSAIWKYDDLEFHFDGRDVESKLCCIYMETTDGVVQISIPKLM